MHSPSLFCFALLRVYECERDQAISVSNRFNDRPRKAGFRSQALWSILRLRQEIIQFVSMALNVCEKVPADVLSLQLQSGHAK